MFWVRRYERADGTAVRGYWRRGAGGESGSGPYLVVLAVVAFALLHHGAPSPAAGPGTSPRPQSTPVYPIKFPEPRHAAPTTRPEPTVSYPIPWIRKR